MFNDFVYNILQLNDVAYISWRKASTCLSYIQSDHFFMRRILKLIKHFFIWTSIYNRISHILQTRYDMTRFKTLPLSIFVLQ